MSCGETDFPKMCSRNYTECDLNRHLTCHKWKGGVTDRSTSAGGAALPVFFGVTEFDSA